MRTIVLALCLALFTSFAIAADTPTKSDAQALVKQAVSYAKENGRAKLFNEVSTSNGKFHFQEGKNKGLYIFVYDEKGVVLAHGTRLDAIGRNRWNDKDTDGKYWVREWTDLVHKSGSGWISYKQYNPEDKNNVESKLSFVELYDGMVIGCGIYAK